MKIPIPHGADQWGVAVAVLTLIVTIVLGVSRPLRAAVRNTFEFLQTLLGVTSSKYRRSFLKENGTVRNIYLGQAQSLDLATTYVPLSLLSSEDEIRQSAANVISDKTRSRTIVIGDPGTGKTTLFRAYSVGIMRVFRASNSNLDKQIRGNKDVPVIVPLRRFARAAEQGPILNIATVYCSRHKSAPGRERHATCREVLQAAVGAIQMPCVPRWIGRGQRRRVCVRP